MVQHARLEPGDPAPTFVQQCSSNPDYRFDTVAGRHIVLCFFASSQDPHARAALEAAFARSDLFDDTEAAFFGVTLDPEDAAGQLQPRIPGYRHFWDMDGKVSKLYGALPDQAKAHRKPELLQGQWVVLDPALRVLRVVPFAEDRGDIGEVLGLLNQLVGEGDAHPVERPAPVLMLPNVFEAGFRKRLLDYFAQNEEIASGFMNEEGGRTVLVTNSQTKRRSDCLINDEALKKEIQQRLRRRVVPEIAKAYQYHVTRLERYVIGHYSEVDQGHFAPHRDNTTKGTAHRRFAMTVALDDDYDGGELVFPEFGRTGYKLKAGTAIVFSCSLLHGVKPVTRGHRHVFLPFMYDDAAAKVREKNKKFLAQ